MTARRQARAVVAVLLIGPVVVAGLLVSDGDSGGPGPAESADETVRVVYEAAYASRTPGKAIWIEYRDPAGEVIRLSDQRVPWESETLLFPEDGRVSLEVRAARKARTNFQCGVVTDQGPYGRNAGASVVDGICRVETTLEDLARGN